ncbi:MAG: hypothetical protein V6Z82_05600 [Flavobacteriales bacterium]
MRIEGEKGANSAAKRTILYSDYRLVQGILFPFHMHIGANLEVSVAEIKGQIKRIPW